MWENIGVEEGKTAYNYFKNGLYLEAGEILDRLMEYPNLKPELLAARYYDRGLMYEVLGNLNKAEELYIEAATLKSSDLHLEALKNIREKIEDVKRLQEQQL
jgi:tetratricopeptide (TPR) repeat protein